MKIGIVTEPLVDNYGGVLQNFALQQVLRKLGYEPITLNYLSSLPFYRYLLYFVKNSLLSIIPSKRKPVKRYHHFIQRPEAFDRFIKDNISITEPLERYSAKAMKKYGIEALIVGSDQVWRREYNPYLEDMFLAFAENYNIPKIAYAASFGKDSISYTSGQLSEAKRLIKKFSAVSVRENSGVRICREELDSNCTLVLDPTLLLEKEDYLKLCERIPIRNQSYILAYVLDITDGLKEDIEKKSRDKNMPVKYVTVSSQSDCSVEEWISLFRDADSIITDSFHGTVFSLIFAKEVDCRFNEGRGADRMKTLYSELLSSEDIAKQLAVKRQASLDFINNSLNGN